MSSEVSVDENSKAEPFSFSHEVTIIYTEPLAQLIIS